jgi:hypothetical protein
LDVHRNDLQVPYRSDDNDMDDPAYADDGTEVSGQDSDGSSTCRGPREPLFALINAATNKSSRRPNISRALDLQ